MKRILGLVVAGLLVFAPLASATSMTYYFTIDHCTGGCGTPPFGAVTLTQQTDAVRVDVVLTPGDRFVDTGFPGAFGFNLVTGAPSISLTGITDGFSSVAGGQFDGFGDFQHAVKWDGGNGGTQGTTQPLEFTVNGTGLTMADFLQISTGPGSDHVYFVADIMGTTGNTGPVGTCRVGENCSTSTVPEPASMLLLGSGLLGAGFFRRRQKKS